MAKKKTTKKKVAKRPKKKAAGTRKKKKSGSIISRIGKPSSLIDTRVVYCGDCREQLKNLPDDCIDLIYIDPVLSKNSADL